MESTEREEGAGKGRKKGTQEKEREGGKRYVERKMGGSMQN